MFYDVPGDSIPRREMTCFSLPNAVLTAVLITGPVAAGRRNIIVGVCLATFLAGVVCVAIGVRTRRRAGTIVGVVLALGALGVAGLSPLTVTAWVGTTELDVYVLVIDASTISPIPDAQIEVVDGPDSPIEGPHPDIDKDFEVVELPGDPRQLTTDKRGFTKFTHRFHAAGSDGIFRDSGYVDTGRTWLRVSSPGYVTTILPLDRQSIRPRDIHDESPLFVTVPVGKR